MYVGMYVFLCVSMYMHVSRYKCICKYALKFPSSLSLS